MGWLILSIYLVGLFTTPFVLYYANMKHKWMTKEDLNHQGSTALCLIIILAVIGWPFVLVITIIGKVFKTLFMGWFPNQ